MAEATEDGTIQAQFTAPESMNESSVTVVAQQRGSDKSATAELMSQGGAATVSIDGEGSGKPGDHVTINATGFTAGEEVEVYWGRSTGTPSATLTADTSGSLSEASVPVGMAPVGTTTLVLVGAKSHATAIAAFQMLGLYPTTTPDPYSVLSGKDMTYSGSGFAPGEQVLVYFNASGGTPALTLEASASGDFSHQLHRPLRADRKPDPDRDRGAEPRGDEHGLLGPAVHARCPGEHLRGAARDVDQLLRERLRCRRGRGGLPRPGRGQCRRARHRLPRRRRGLGRGGRPVRHPERQRSRRSTSRSSVSRAAARASRRWAWRSRRMPPTSRRRRRTSCPAELGGEVPRRRRLVVGSPAPAPAPARAPAPTPGLVASPRRRPPRRPPGDHPRERRRGDPCSGDLRAPHPTGAGVPRRLSPSCHRRISARSRRPGGTRTTGSERRPGCGSTASWRRRNGSRCRRPRPWRVRRRWTSPAGTAGRTGRSGRRRPTPPRASRPAIGSGATGSSSSLR